MSFSAIFLRRNNNTSNRYELCPSATGGRGIQRISVGENYVTVASALILILLLLLVTCASFFISFILFSLPLLKHITRPPTAIYICHKREMTLENLRYPEVNILSMKRILKSSFVLITSSQNDVVLLLFNLQFHFNIPHQRLSRYTSPHLQGIHTVCGPVTDVCLSVYLNFIFCLPTLLFILYIFHTYFSAVCC